MPKIKNYYTELHIAGFTILLFCGFAIMGVDPHHDGIMLKTAADIYNGQILFRDTYSHYGAMTVFLQSAVLLGFGVQLIAVRLLTVFFYGMISVLLYKCSEMVLTRYFKWLPLIIFWLLPPFYLAQDNWYLIPWSSVYSLFGVLLMLFLILKYLDTDGEKYFYFIGMSAAFSFWCRQSLIIISLAAIIFILLLPCNGHKTARRLLRLVAGFTIFSLPFIFYLITFGAINDWLMQNFKYAFSFAFSQNTNINFLLQLFSCLFPMHTGFIIFPVVNIALMLYLIYTWVRRQWTRKELQVLAVVLVGGASLHQYFPVACPRHWYWAAIPAFIAFTYLIEYLFFQKKFFGKIFAVGILLLLLPDICLRGKGIINHLRTLPERQFFNEAPMRYMLLNAQEMIFFTEIKHNFSIIPERYRNMHYINLSTDAWFNLYFPKQQNFHPLYINMDGVYSDYGLRLHLFIKKNQPILVYCSDQELPAQSYFSKTKYPYHQLFIYILLPKMSNRDVK